MSLLLPEKAVLVDKLLCEAYGAPFAYFSDKDPLSEMVSSWLSHRTKNKVTGIAYRNLRSIFPTWEAVRDAPVQDVKAAIAAVTFPEVKAPRIQHALRYITIENGGVLSLDFLEDWPVEKARAWLEQIPGLGAKTSAAVLNFSRLRKAALVVDTHHLRVAQRIGLVPPKCSLEVGAKLLESYLPKEWDALRVYDSHQAFMRHGKQVCLWAEPMCERCIVREWCDYYRQKRLPG